MNRTAAGYAAIITLLVITGFFSINLFMRQRVERDLVDVTALPYSIDGWKGADLTITEREYEILETRNLVSREYTDPTGRTVYLFIVYSETNRSVIHPPEVCMMGGGLEIAGKAKDSIEVDNKTFFVNKLYLEKGSHRQLVLYAYKAGPLYTDSYPVQQAKFALNQLLGKHGGGATVRVSAELAESEEKTLALLKRFMVSAIERLEKLKRRTADVSRDDFPEAGNGKSANSIPK